MNTKRLIKLLSKYCDKIVYNGGHYKAYLTGKGVITISATSSDINYTKQVARDFRRLGVVIKEII